MGFDLGAQQDVGAKVYWKLPFGYGTAKKPENHSHFGFKMIEREQGNIAFHQALSGQVMSWQQRQPLLDIRVNADSFAVTDIRLNGVNFADPNAVRLGQGDSTVVFGMEYWQLGMLAIGVGAVGWVVYDTLEDDDDDAPADNSGGAGLAVSVAGGALPAVAMDLSGDQEANAKLYWKMPFGGDKRENTEDRAHFGFSMIERDAGNVAFAQALSGSTASFKQRPAMFDMRLDAENFKLTGLSLNGINFADPAVVQLGQGEEGTIMGLQFWQAGLLAVGLVGAGWIIYDSVEDDDDDAPAAGGGGTTGTPLDVALDPLAEQSPI
ncbi:unnamed protein product [Symbiodinium microadriaticum]|nr:unnamed protein product [Symbiodinium microadriaticum]